MAAVFEAIFEALFGLVFGWTGEIILFVVTLGRHKPRWDLYTSESPTKFVIFSELSTWLGIVFWLFVLGVVARLALQ